MPVNLNDREFSKVEFSLIRSFKTPLLRPGKRNLNLLDTFKSKQLTEGTVCDLKAFLEISGMCERCETGHLEAV